MSDMQILGAPPALQGFQPLDRGFPRLPGASIPALLGNTSLQTGGVGRLVHQHVRLIFSKLDLLKWRHSNSGDKARRVENALAALNQQNRISLTAADWQWIADDSDIEEQP